MTRNLIYQIKKEAAKRTMPLYQPNDQEQTLQNEVHKLRSTVRCQQTQIIRLKHKIEQLQSKLTFHECQQKLQFQQTGLRETRKVSEISKIPILLENTQLKQKMQIIHKESLILNGKNNELQRQMRQNRGQLIKLQKRVKELQILQNMRAQRFQDELDRLTPIVVGSEHQQIPFQQGIKSVLNFITKQVVETVFRIFILSSKECQNQKQLNSFTVFLNYWNNLKANKQNGLNAAVVSLLQLTKLYRLFDEQYPSIDQNEYKDTLNDWVLKSIIDIKTAVLKKQQERRLFRMLGLYYRSKFPIKGQHFEINEDVQAYLHYTICQEIYQLL